MKTVTCADILDDAIDWGNEHYCIYAIKERTGQIIYVGKLRNPIDRLWLHVGQGRGCPSSVGQLVLDFASESHAWEIDLFDIRDCYKILGEEYIHNESLKRRDVMIIESKVDQAETVLIRKHAPYFNGAKMDGIDQIRLPKSLDSRKSSCPFLCLQKLIDT